MVPEDWPGSGAFASTELGAGRTRGSGDPAEELQKVPEGLARSRGELNKSSVLHTHPPLST